MKIYRALGLTGLTAMALTLTLGASSEDAAYVAGIETWRAEREANLKKDNSWLTVAGLFWLREGESTVGADPTADFVLPEGSAPARVGTFVFKAGDASFRPAEGVKLTYQDVPLEKTVALEMGEDHALHLGRLSMWLHYSGDRKAIRLRDLESPIRKDFVGLSWFPVDPAYRVTAKFEPYPEPKEVEILNILGDIERYESPGTVTFELHGQTVTMEPLSTSDGGLWLIFRDGTSGKESYPAARFLRGEPPEGGVAVIDFNQSYNPPCAYNPYTTCPMPKKENRLTIRIEAGEKTYAKGHL